jgi:hypothetical protein
LAGATALTGASVTSSAAPSAEAKAPHVLKWKWLEIAEHEVGRNGAVATQVIRSRRTNQILGYVSLTGKLLPAQNGLAVQAAAAVKGGLIIFRAQAPVSAEALTGRVVSGTGKFKGFDGTWPLREALGTTQISLVTLRVDY